MSSPSPGAPTVSSSEYVPASNASSCALSCESKFGYSGALFSSVGDACPPPSSPYVSDPATNTTAPSPHRTKIDQDRTSTFLNIPPSLGKVSLAYAILHYPD